VKAVATRLAAGAVVMAQLVLLTACGHPAEKALVDQFFSASRLRDRTAAQSVSTVFFDPKDQGLVRQFTIKGVTPEEENGGVASKNVTLNASVESLEGVQSQKIIFVTMQRRPGAAWMITGVTVAGDPGRPPR
jgi:hypothetical protein